MAECTPGLSNPSLPIPAYGAAEGTAEDIEAGNSGCQLPCAAIFSHISVTPTIKQGTRVEWGLLSSFRDPGPYQYTLQVGRTGNPRADDWVNVGTPAYDVFYMEDDQQRVYGMTNWTHYRLRVVTGLNTYYSAPIPVNSALSRRDRMVYLALLKTWSQNMRLNIGQEGYLLKRKLFGEPCPDSPPDWQTGEVTKPGCLTCFGTGFTGGYFAPIPCVYAAMDPNATHNQLDTPTARGTIDDEMRVTARMIAVPQMFENDVWVDKAQDTRWIIHKIKNIVEVRGVPVVCQVELRLAQFTDPIYDFVIPGQVTA